MMELLRAWIMGITCAAVLLAVAQSLMPEGGVRKVGSLAGGLLLLLAVAAPLVELDGAALSVALTEYHMTQWGSGELLEIENTRLVKEIIAQRTAAYISDKAKELGATCTAEVTYEYTEEGEVYPVSVTVWGELTAAQRGELTRFIEAQLAIPEEDQSYEGVTDP